MPKTFSMACLFLSAVMSGCAVADTATTNNKNRESARQSASQHSEATFSGRHGRMSVGGDIVEIKNGEVTVNGISYGKVSPDSQIRYSVEGQKRQLLVNGETRTPQR